MDDRSPLLRNAKSPSPEAVSAKDLHTQFCILTGITPSDLLKDAKWPKPSRTSIYQRAKHKEASQNRIYLFTATLTNTLLLSQIVIGAILTALGASGSTNSLIFVAVFGAVNTVIAGLVTYLKSRGQPMRARMFRDDLERVIDEVENSEIMWLGIARQMNGYNAYDVDDKVSVRGEVARLTRLYNEAVKNNTNNNPDLYLNSTGSEDTSGFRPKVVGSSTSDNSAAAVGPAPTAAPAPISNDSPATADVKAPEPSDNKTSTPAAETANPTPATDPTQSNGQAKPPQPNGQSQTPPATPMVNAVPTASAARAPTALADDTDEGPVTMDLPPKKTSESKTSDAAKK